MLQRDKLVLYSIIVCSGCSVKHLKDGDKIDTICLQGAPILNGEVSKKAVSTSVITVSVECAKRNWCKET